MEIRPEIELVLEIMTLLFAYKTKKVCACVIDAKNREPDAAIELTLKKCEGCDRDSLFNRLRSDLLEILEKVECQKN